MSADPRDAFRDWKILDESKIRAKNGHHHWPWDFFQPGRGLGFGEEVLYDTRIQYHDSPDVRNFEPTYMRMPYMHWFSKTRMTYATETGLEAGTYTDPTFEFMRWACDYLDTAASAISSYRTIDEIKGEPGLTDGEIESLEDQYGGLSDSRRDMLARMLRLASVLNRAAGIPFTD